MSNYVPKFKDLSVGDTILVYDSQSTCCWARTITSIKKKNTLLYLYYCDEFGELCSIVHPNATCDVSCSILTFTNSLALEQYIKKAEREEFERHKEKILELSDMKTSYIWQYENNIRDNRL